MSRLRAALREADTAYGFGMGFVWDRYGFGMASLADLAPAPTIESHLANGLALRLSAPSALIGALAALDGRAARLLLIAPALPPEATRRLMEGAGIEALVSDRPDAPGLGAISPQEAFAAVHWEGPAAETDWILTTSGTTGLPKMVRHRLDGLARTVRPPRGGERPVWGLLYEPTRFAGLQVVLQAVLGGGVLAAADSDAPIEARLAHLAEAGASHLSATPTLWRRILMDARAASLRPSHITLGGEIADQPVLDALARRYPAASIRHIYASTEAGVGFSVRDGLAGFPAAWLGAAPAEGQPALRIADGRLWLRPPGAPPASEAARDAEGFIDTGDRIEIVEGRARFLGRETSAVNIGGVKIQPEDVEAVVAEHPDVALARAGTMASPITGKLLTLTVVAANPEAAPQDLRRAIAAHCRERLPKEARPAKISVVDRTRWDATAVTAGGKLSRQEAGP